MIILYLYHSEDAASHNFETSWKDENFELVNRPQIKIEKPVR